jgi:hypothetical protein
MDSEINKMCQQKITTVMLATHRAMEGIEVGGLAVMG